MRNRKAFFAVQGSIILGFIILNVLIFYMVNCNGEYLQSRDVWGNTQTILKSDLKSRQKLINEFSQNTAKAVVCAFAVTVFVTSFKLLWMQSVSNQVSPGLGLPMIVPYFAITFSFAIISIVQVSTLVNMVIKLFTGEKEASV